MVFSRDTPIETVKHGMGVVALFLMFWEIWGEKQITCSKNVSRMMSQGCLNLTGVLRTLHQRYLTASHLTVAGSQFGKFMEKCKGSYRVPQDLVYFNFTVYHNLLCHVKKK